jgi:hypothetical protein
MNRKVVLVTVACSLAAFFSCAGTSLWAGEGSGQTSAPAPAATGQASGGAVSHALSEADRNAAVAAVEAWLKLLDEGKYEESYKEAGAYFRNSVSEGEWLRAIATFRGPHGKATSRKKISTTTTPPLEGLPEGDYFVVEYETNFEKKQNCTENVTALKDPEGKWRVIGYHLTQSAPEAENKPGAQAN